MSQKHESNPDIDRDASSKQRQDEHMYRFNPRSRQRGAREVTDVITRLARHGTSNGNFSNVTGDITHGSTGNDILRLKHIRCQYGIYVHGWGDSQKKMRSVSYHNVCVRQTLTRIQYMGEG